MFVFSGGIPESISSVKDGAFLDGGLDRSEPGLDAPHGCNPEVRLQSIPIRSDSPVRCRVAAVRAKISLSNPVATVTCRHAYHGVPPAGWAPHPTSPRPLTQKVTPGLARTDAVSGSALPPAVPLPPAAKPPAANSAPSSRMAVRYTVALAPPCRRCAGTTHAAEGLRRGLRGQPVSAGHA